MKYTGKALKIDGETLKQVNALSARKSYNSGMIVWMHPNNMAFINAWQRPLPVSRGCGITFDDVVTSLLASTPRELGTDLHYFIKV